jgi:hypothetical protein
MCQMCIFASLRLVPLQANRKGGRRHSGPSRSPLTLATMAASGSRTAHAQAILGPELSARLPTLRVLLVGAGGIGCELRAWHGPLRRHPGGRLTRRHSQEPGADRVRRYHPAGLGYYRPFQLESTVSIQEEGCEALQGTGKSLSLAFTGTLPFFEHRTDGIYR